MAPSGVQFSKLSSGGDGAFGLSCTEEGLFLGHTALVERHAQGYVVRPPAELERLLARAYGTEIPLHQVMPGFRVVAAALDAHNLGLAHIAAVHLRMPDLPDEIARASLETEDRLIKSGRGDNRLARSGWIRPSIRAPGLRATRAGSPGWMPSDQDITEINAEIGKAVTRGELPISSCREAIRSASKAAMSM